MNMHGQNDVLPGTPGDNLNKSILDQKPSATNRSSLKPLKLGIANGVTSSRAHTGVISSGVGVNQDIEGSTGPITGGAITAQYSSSYQQTSVSNNVSVESVAQSLGAALNEVPWIQFQVIAQPDLNLFMSDARLQAFIRCIIQVTVASVTEEIVQKFNQTTQLLIAGINQTVSERMARATQNILQQITSISGVGGVTAFQTLGTVNVDGVASGVPVGSTVGVSSSVNDSTGSVSRNGFPIGGGFNAGGATAGEAVVDGTNAGITIMGNTSPGGAGGGAIDGLIRSIPLSDIVPPPDDSQPQKTHWPDCPNKDDIGQCDCPDNNDGGKGRNKHRLDCSNKDERGECDCPADSGDETCRKNHKPNYNNEDNRGSCDCPDDSDDGKKHESDCLNKDDGGRCECQDDSEDDDSCPPLFPNQKPINVAPPDLANGKWIWTKEVIAGGGTVPGGVRPFRKTITPQCPVNRLTVDITCDNFYTLYVNGKLVGSGMNYQVPQRYTVAFENTTKVVVAVFAGQDPDSLAQVGLICVGVIWQSQEKNPQGIPFNTDATWKTVAADRFDMNFFRENYNDSTWENAIEEVPYGGGVWGPVTKPTVNNVPGSGPPLQGALKFDANGA